MSKRTFALFAPFLLVGCAAGSSAGSQNPGSASYDGFYSETGASKNDHGTSNGQTGASDGNKPQPRTMTTARGRSPRKGKARSLIAKKPVRDDSTSKPKPAKDLPTPDAVTLTGFSPTLVPSGSVVTVFGAGLDQPGTSVVVGGKTQKIVEQAPDRLVFQSSGASGPVEVRARILRKMKTAKSKTELEVIPKKGPFAKARKDAKHGLVGEVYKLTGDEQELPDFGALGAPVAVIAVPNLDFASKNVRSGLAGIDAYAVHFRGSLNVLEDGEYRLCLNAGDGAQLHLNQTLVVDNDGRHETTEVCEPVAIEAGNYDLDLLYYQAEPGEMGLQFLWAKDDGDKTPVPTSVLFPPEEPATVAMR